MTLNPNFGREAKEFIAIDSLRMMTLSELSMRCPVYSRSLGIPSQTRLAWMGYNMPRS